MNALSAFFAKRKDGDLQPLAGLLLLTLIGYLPISSGLFALKNDDFIYFLPYRYNISEIIRSGHLPLWSPYIYMGFPIAGDMQSGAWNPLVWLISLTGTYDLNRLAAEILICLFLSGAGIYKLGRVLKFNKTFAFTIGISFTFSGFMLDSGQILCWVACASILPFTYLYFIRLVQTPGMGNAVKFSIANVLLALAGYPAFFIINGYILLMISIILFANQVAKKNYEILKITIPYFILAAGLFLLTGMIAWLSFAEMLPYYNRGQGVSLGDALEHSYQSRFGLTAFAPFAYTWATPPLAGDSGIIRNIYFGILLIPFALYGALFRRNFLSNLVLVITIIAIASSLGTALPVRSFEFHFLPLMNSFRHPANFRVFVIIGLLVLAGKGLQQVYCGPKNLSLEIRPASANLLPKIFYGPKTSTLVVKTLLILLMIGIAGFAIEKFLTLSGQNRTDLKSLMEGLKSGHLFDQALLVNLFFQLVFLILGLITLIRDKYRLYCLLSILNIILLAVPGIFYGMVSSASPAAMNEHIRQLPAGFPAGINDKPVGAYTSTREVINYGRFSGIGSFYLKRPVINGSFNNPTILTSYQHFLRDTGLVMELGKYAAVFFGDRIMRSGEEIKVLKKVNKTGEPEILMRSFGPNEISFSAKSNDDGMMSVFQNNYPGWRAFIDDKPVELFTVNYTFMGIIAPAGTHVYQLKYRPMWLLPGIICSFTGIVVCACLLARKHYRIRYIFP